MTSMSPIAWRTVWPGSRNHAWSRRTDSANHFWIRPSTIFSRTFSGFAATSSWLARISRSLSTSACGTCSRVRKRGRANERCIARSRASASEPPRTLTIAPTLFAGGWTYATIVSPSKRLPPATRVFSPSFATRPLRPLPLLFERLYRVRPVGDDRLERPLGERLELLVLRHRLRLAADRDERAR